MPQQPPPPPSRASSPYAPARRNSYLRRSSSSLSVAPASSAGGTAAWAASSTALLVFVLRFWRDAYHYARHRRGDVWERLQSPKEWWARLTCAIADGSAAVAWGRITSPSLGGDGGDSRVGAVTGDPPRNTGGTASSATDHGEAGALESRISAAGSSSSSLSSEAERIRANLRAIEGVLSYWFGQYPPETAQKKLWMIAASSAEHRRTVDAEIADKFEALLLELSAPTATTMSPSRWDEWCHDPDGLYGARGKVAAIVVLDQFSRHIARHRAAASAKRGDGKNAAAPGHGRTAGQQQQKQQQQQQQQQQRPPPTQEASDRRALEAARLFARDHADEADSCLVPLPMSIFALMPFRHAGTMESVRYVQGWVGSAEIRQSELGAMLGRFRKATNRRMAALQDEARRTGGGAAASSAPAGGKAVEGGPETLPPGGGEFSDEDILETFPFQADMTPARRHPVHETVVAFLSDRGIRPASPPGGKGRDEAGPSRPPLASVVVSLSGGVDSMVLASVLADLRASCGYQHLNVTAVHIDYANRPESCAEADFVRRYCHDTLGVPLACRRIGEVTRGVTARRDYERVAREIRFDAYRDAVAFAASTAAAAGGGMGHPVGRSDDAVSDGTAPVVGVVLGHHRGDLRENVLSNAHKGCGPLDLSGMTAVSKNDGIVLYRPLLPLEKSSVLDYAHKFGIPYFKDTTPHWSTRGKLRNKLLPLLEEIYGDGSMNNLSNLAVESDECRALLQKSTIGPFLDSIVRTPMGIILDTAPWKDQAVFFWKFVLREALHSASLGMFSDKSVVSFLERVRARNVTNAWLQCRKDYGVYLQDDGKVFVVYPESFPWNAKDAYSATGKVDFGTDTLVGPWTIRSEVVEIEQMDRQTYLAKKAIPTMGSLMEGKIEYYVEAPTMFDDESRQFAPRPLVFRKFTKADRPHAWKHSDLKVQTTLPLLGNDEVANTMMKETSDVGLARDGNGGSSKHSSTCLIRISLDLQQQK